MSDVLRIALVGATGLIGRAVIAQSVGREDMRILAIARREMKLPEGARMEMVVADPDAWGDVFKQFKPDVLICAIGTTWNKAGKSEDAFRAVDQRLVLDTAQSAHAHGIQRLMIVSAIGADTQSKSFYLKVKGEVERDLLKIGFDRVDILRPGLLRGQRAQDRRIGERLGIIVSPLTDLLMRGSFSKYRSIRDSDLAKAALALSMRKASGKFVHEHDALMLAAKNLPQPHEFSGE